ncbi:MAG: hypothetical protein RBR15_10050 [Sphaerochaeta sp.]|nr:hypothetical protein [Sphaerochaeta sp.]
MALSTTTVAVVQMFLDIRYPELALTGEPDRASSMGLFFLSKDGLCSSLGRGRCHQGGKAPDGIDNGSEDLDQSNLLYMMAKNTEEHFYQATFSKESGISIGDTEELIETVEHHGNTIIRPCIPMQ